MEQTRALHALEPFLVLSKSATSPRAAADLVTRATSAPNTYLFAELLQTPAIQSLAASDFASHLTLLEIFSYGTYAAYVAAGTLPDLAEPQTLKLRQLSLLTLARDRANLTYAALQSALGLSSAREVEDLVISAVYAGLLHAKLDPARAAVHVHSVAPLRDLAPGVLPEMVAALRNWEGRCTTTLDDLETQVLRIRAAAAKRLREQRAADEKLKALMADDSGRVQSGGRDPMRKHFPKRPVKSSVHDPDQMDLDDEEEPSRRVSKRKL